MTSSGSNSRQISARSLALSLLLGTHPPRLPVAALIAAGELFGVSAGTMRTALSRMTTAGELASDSGQYSLAGRFVDRQIRQDHGRLPTGKTWDGNWVTVAPRSSSRSLAERRELRRELEALRLGELRPDYWLRPANVDLQPLESAARAMNLIVVVGAVSLDDQHALVSELWPLDMFRHQAGELRQELSRLTDSAREGADPGGDNSSDDKWLVEGFFTAADVVRFLTKEPRLPPGLLASPSEADKLRVEYDRFEPLFQKRLAQFFRAAVQSVS